MKRKLKPRNSRGSALKFVKLLLNTKKYGRHFLRKFFSSQRQLCQVCQCISKISKPICTFVLFPYIVNFSQNELYIFCWRLNMLDCFYVKHNGSSHRTVFKIRISLMVLQMITLPTLCLTLAFFLLRSYKLKLIVWKKHMKFMFFWLVLYDGCGIIFSHRP